MRKSILHVEDILRWADDHFAKTGKWPKKHSGRVLAARDEKWQNIDMALHAGYRGFPGRWSLAQLLAEYRGARNHKRLPRLTIAKILSWVDEYRAATGRWPQVLSGEIKDSDGHTWRGVNVALVNGGRGLRGGSSLAEVLRRHRKVRNARRPSRLSVAKILTWADRYRRRTGRWPTCHSGTIPGTAGDTWLTVNKALQRGRRGLKGHSSLRQLLIKCRRATKLALKQPLTEPQVIAWATGHYRRTGRWPGSRSGPVLDAPGETWCGIANALRGGFRGFRPGRALWRLCEVAAKRKSD
jgi:hypothetical protein